MRSEVKVQSGPMGTLGVLSLTTAVSFSGVQVSQMVSYIDSPPTQQSPVGLHCTAEEHF